MPSNFDSLSCSDPAAQVRWQSLWETSPQRTAFSSLTYARCAAAAYGLRIRMHLVRHDGPDQAGAIVFWRQRIGWRHAITPPFTQYSSLLLARRPPESVVHRRKAPLETLLLELKHRYRPLRLLVDVTDPRPAQWLRWRVSPLFTYRLALSDTLGGWSESTQRTFRKHHHQFDIMEDNTQAEAIVRLCAASYQRHGRPLPTATSQLVQLIGSLNRHVRCFVATRTASSSAEAGLAILHDGHTAHYWVAGSMPGPSMTVLIGKVLPLLYEDGITRFDFVGANTASIAEFKRHFGPTLTQYYCLEKHR